MRGKRDAYGVDPATGFDGVRATPEELAAWFKSHPRQPVPSVARSRCQRCGTRIWHSGVGVGGHRRACPGAPPAVDGVKSVIHVRNDSADGAAVTRAQVAMKRWHDRGYSVCPVPADGRNHPYDRVCGWCTKAAA